MKFASFLLGVLIGLAAFTPAAHADLPDGTVAVVRVTAVDGLAHYMADRFERSTAFGYDGTEYAIKRSVLPSLDGIQTLVLIDHRTDTREGDTTVRHHTQEVRAYEGTSFEVTDFEGKVLSYQVAMLGGNLRLLGDGDQIMAQSGPGGPYQVWRIDRVDLVDRRQVALR